MFIWEAIHCKGNLPNKNLNLYKINPVFGTERKLDFEIDL